MWMKNYVEKRYHALFLVRATRLIVSRLVCAIDQTPLLLFIIITITNFLGERRISMILRQVLYRRPLSELVHSHRVPRARKHELAVRHIQKLLLLLVVEQRGISHSSF